MRPPAPLPSFPHYSALPFPPQLPLYRHDWPEDLFASANKRRPVASVLLGRTKQKQSKTGQRSFEAAAGAEVLRRGRRTRDVDKRRRRPKGSVAAARVMRLGGLRPLPQPLSLLGGSRSLGGGGGVEAAAGSDPALRPPRSNIPRGSAWEGVCESPGLRGGSGCWEADTCPPPRPCTYFAAPLVGCGKWGPLFIAVRGPLFIAVRGPLTIAAPPVAGHRLQTRRLNS
ncbi:hypothetical protein J1605_022045 [Eschrichtius robustus]|uniref:Uncharacterized protein n=1 Tax=Eschrichtius robustus TaxID=9764 RepID=A0AB34HBW5_ESCRO|nr:hypothetical protein J1605_022045 [Eschrichtius robustus]